MKKVIMTIIVIVVVMAAASLSVIYGGLYDVAASTPDSPLMRWALTTTRENVVKREAKSIEVPQTVRQPDQELLRTGFVHYDEMCVNCHAAPGVEAGEIRAGLNPMPPRLAKRAGKRSLAELFWVSKHGIKMTGMPAWGETHSDEELWAVVAFVKHLSKLSAEEYAALREQGDDVGHGHEDHAH